MFLYAFKLLFRICYLINQGLIPFGAAFTFETGALFELSLLINKLPKPNVQKYQWYKEAIPFIWNSPHTHTPKWLFFFSHSHAKSASKTQRQFKGYSNSLPKKKNKKQKHKQKKKHRTLFLFLSVVMLESLNNNTKHLYCAFFCLFLSVTYEAFTVEVSFHICLPYAGIGIRIRNLFFKVIFQASSRATGWIKCTKY